MRTLALFLASIVGSSCLPFAVQADIAPDPMSGGVSLEVPGSSQTEIALRHNTVKIQVSPSRCKTRAFFRLHNTGKDTNLEVGFPLTRKGEAADFQVFVDNKSIGFNDKTKEGTTPIGQKRIRRWKAWTMNFAPNATHLVEVRYSNQLSEGWSRNLSDFYYPTYREWETTGKDYNVGDYGYKERAELHDWLQIKQAEYILVTGSYWKGPIERCRVEVDVENVATDSIADVQPPPKSFSPRQIVWQWNNVELPRNIGIVFVGGLSPRRTIIPYVEKIAAQNPQDEKIQTTLTMMKQDFPNEQKEKERQNSFFHPNNGSFTFPRVAKPNP